jgi:hypothetical protein
MLDRLRLEALAGAVLVLAACDPGASPSGEPARDPAPTASIPAPATPSPSPSPAVSQTGCPNEARATRRGLIPAGLRGDVDGDGRRDRIRLAVDQTGPDGCRAFLVRTDRGEREVAAIDEPRMSFDLGLPTLDSARPIDDEPGDEIVVTLVSGTSTQFYGMFTAAANGLVRITIEEGPHGDLFPYGGSIEHLESSDCSDDPPGLVISGAVPRGDDFEIRRSFYSFEGHRLKALEEASQDAVVPFEELVSFPEFGQAPFANCGR